MSEICKIRQKIGKKRKNNPRPDAATVGATLKQQIERSDQQLLLEENEGRVRGLRRRGAERPSCRFDLAQRRRGVLRRVAPVPAELYVAQLAVFAIHFEPFLANFSDFCFLGEFWCF